MPNKDLLKNQAYIDGQWVDSKNGTFDVLNPADGSLVGSVPDMGAPETKQAIEAAKKALPAWAAKTAKERAVILRRWGELMIEHADDLAALMTAEQGKPVAEARGEIIYGASFLEWFAEEGKRAYGDVIPSPISDSRILTMKQPIGVCALITPWNFPSAMITRKAAPALAAGCTCVCKPAEDTPLSALALAVLAEEAGVPPGVFNVVTGSNPAAIGDELCENRSVRKLSFTGSTEVGKTLMRQCAGTLKKLSLELGGNAPFIVFEDADIEEALDGLMMCKFRNAGQTCVSANRIYVHESLYDEFADKLAARVADLELSPLINEAALQKVEALVADAVQKGAKIRIGGKKDSRGGNYFEPTILTDFPADQMADLTCQEIFGPVAALYSFSSEQEVINQANSTNYGLAAYFYARDGARIWRVSEALEFGMVAVNAGILSTEVAPFGGIKESGLGREGSKYGLDEFLEMKYTLISGINT